MGDGSEELTDVLDFNYSFKPGIYTVTMKLNNCGECEFDISDTIVAGERLDPGLPDEASACDQTLLEAMKGDHGFFWSDNTNNENLLVFESGEYWVMLVDKQGFYNSDTTQVTIHVSPVVQLDSFPLLCSSEEQYLLNEGKPVGGIYSGHFISGSVFDVTEAGPGFHEVTYYFEDVFGCSDSVSSILEVEATSYGSLLVQNRIFPGPVYLTGDTITVGSQVDFSNPFGSVWVQDGADAYFKAGMVISLKPGTHIQPGSRFRGVILPLSCVQAPEKSIYQPDPLYVQGINVTAVPNPTTGRIRFFSDLYQEDSFNVKVYNSRGQLIFTRGNQYFGQSAIDLTGFPDGIYYAKLSNTYFNTGIKLLKK